MIQGPESRETKRIIDDIQAKYPDAFVQKISAATPFVRRGLPDIYACINGVSWWFEVKIYPNKLSPSQLDCIVALVAAGGNVAVLTVCKETPSKWSIHYAIHRYSMMNQAGGILPRLRGEDWDMGYVVEGLDYKRKEVTQ